jgi:Fic family protein
MASEDNRRWPAVESELLPWKSTLDSTGAASRRQVLKHRGPYKAALVPMISDRALSLPVVELAAADEAAVELSRFDAEIGQMIAPFASILLRSEAASSSQIENLASSPAAIVQAELGLEQSPSASLVVNNQNAMTAAVNASSKLDSNSLLKMHKVLMQQSDPANAGRFRDQPVWIGGTALGPHGADYVGPDSRKVPALILDLVGFCNRIDLPALVQVAIAHAQFETIHPFTDGNGRTGRALVQVLLHRLGVTKSVMVPVSAGLLRNTADYFAALDQYRLGDPSKIIRVFSEASILAVQNGRALAAELEAVKLNWEDLLTTRSDSGAKQLLGSLLGQPLITSARAVEILGRTPANAQLAIDKLVEVGILTQSGTAKRNRIWQAEEVLTALNNFAKRTKR